MAVPIKMPDLGTTVEECEIKAWLVSEGDTVSLGDELAEIETDKAVVALESTAAGTILRLLVQPGDMAHTGDILAYVGKPGEALPAGEPTVAAGGAGKTTVTPAVPPSLAKSLPVSPVVRNLAAKVGVDLGTVTGTGQGGIITREDVLRAGKEPSSPVSSEPGAAALSRGQAAVARAVSKSWSEIPHLAITASIDMSAAREVRGKYAAQDVRLSYDALFLKAMAGAAATVPLMASRLENDRVIPARGIHLALAIGTDNDLALPVLRDIDQKSLAEIQAEIRAIVAQSQAGKLKAEQLIGGCIALSNLGMYPIDSFDTIIFPGHTAILAVGAVQDRPVVIEGKLEIRPVVTVKLAADHRLVNGRTAAQFVTVLKNLIERGPLE